MTEELSPPEVPIPGWYDDPSESARYRWWDGSKWTASVAPKFVAEGSTGTHPPPGRHPAPSGKPGLGSVSEWVQETTRSAVSRAGHFLPMLLIVVLPLGVLSAVPLWFALRDVIITIDPEAQTYQTQNLGWSAAMAGLIAINLATMLASFILSGAVSHQVLPTAEDEAQHPWSASLMHALRRAPRILGYSFARTMVYFVPLAGVVVLTAFVSSAFVLLVFMLLPIFAVLWVRLCLVDVSASIGPADTSPFKISWALTGSGFFPLFGRLLLLLLLGLTAMLMFVILGQPFTSLAAGDTAVIQSDPDVVNFGDLLGPSLSLLALSSFFSTLGSGFRDVVLAVGGTKLYQRLRGPVDDSFLAKVEAAPVV